MYVKLTINISPDFWSISWHLSDFLIFPRFPDNWSPFHYLPRAHFCITVHVVHYPFYHYQVSPTDDSYKSSGREGVKMTLPMTLKAAPAKRPSTRLWRESVGGALWQWLMTARTDTLNAVVCTLTRALSALDLKAPCSSRNYCDGGDIFCLPFSFPFRPISLFFFFLHFSSFPFPRSQWRSRTFGRPGRWSNLPPFRLRFLKLESLFKA